MDSSPKRNGLVGQILGRYRVLAKIGTGGMGEVYRARDERLERDVALKVLRSGTLLDEAARKRFRKEALALPTGLPRCHLRLGPSQNLPRG